MALPPFASVDDVSARLPAGETVEDARAEAALDDASAIIRAVARKDWVTEDELDADVPDVLLTICCRAAVRALTNPRGLESETTGPFGAQYANASADVYLTRAERDMIRSVAGQTSGVWTLGTTRSDGTAYGDLVEVDGTFYIDVVGSEPFPFIDAGSVV